MEEPIVIEVSGAPVGKGRARFVRSTGVAFTPAKTRSYESHIKLAAHNVMLGRQPIYGPVFMRVSAFIPVPQSWSQRKQAMALLNILRPTTRPDVDNYLKLAADALNEIVFHDDRQIIEAAVFKTYSNKPMLRIEVREI